MKSIFILGLLLSGCAPTSFPPPPQEESGAMCRGSKAWKAAGMACALNHCTKIVDGPIAIDYIKSSPGCRGDLAVVVLDSYKEEVSEIGNTYGGPLLMTRNILVLPEGAGLYIRETTPHDDNRDCYIAWHGVRPY